jgi:peptidoglycan/LPS O-acetylase OafA/YrhL
LLLGPKIALLAPIWASGVLLYRWRALERLPLALAWVMVIASTALIIGLHANGFFEAIARWFAGVVGEVAYRELTFSKFFVGDYLLMVLVFCNFAGMRRVAPLLTPFFTHIATPVKWLAGYTFTLYLLHQPLFLFWGAVWRGDPRTVNGWLVVTALTAPSILVIGHFTEQRREPLRRALLSLLQRAHARLRPLRRNA